MSTAIEEQTHTTKVLERVEYGRLWPDGTFDPIHWTDEALAHRKFTESLYELSGVPQSLRPVFASRRVVTTTETYTAERMWDK